MIDMHRVRMQGASRGGACLAATTGCYRRRAIPGAGNPERPRTPMTRRFRPPGSRWFAAVACAAVAAACSSSTSPNGSVSAVTVTPDTDSVAVGSTVTLQAAVMGPNGQVVSGQHVFWNTGNAAIATVSDAGVVTGVAAGQVQIAASAGGVSGVAAITVLPPPVASVEVSPANDTITLPGTAQLTATAFDAQHNPLANRAITWSSNVPNIANVDGTGLVTGVAAGTATITASSEGKSGTAAVVVLPPVAASVTVAPTTTTLSVGDSTTLTATAKDASGNVIAGAPVTWSSDNPAAATVSSSGVVTAVGIGTATITAQSGNAKGTATILVAPLV